MAGTILLVGAGDGDVDRLDAVLREIGCRVWIRSAATAEEAAASFGHGPAPALVLLAERVGGVPSVSVLEVLRGHVDLDQVPVVVLVEDEDGAHDAGFARLGSALLERAGDETGFRDQVERLAERFLNDWVLARPMPPRAGGDGS